MVGVAHYYETGGTTMAEETQVALRTDSGMVSMTLKQVTDRVNLVHSVLETVMKKGTHYGTVTRER